MSIPGPPYDAYDRMMLRKTVRENIAEAKRLLLQAHEALVALGEDEIAAELQPLVDCLDLEEKP